MAISEQYGSCKITINRTAMTGERIFVCDWSERKTHAPRLGDSFPGELWLRCSSLEIEGIGRSTGPGSYEKAKVIARYNTYQWVDDQPVESWEFGGEILETAIGRVWVGTSEICDQAYGVFYPSAIRTITLTLPGVPIAAIFNNLGKVNGNWLMDIPPEHALFEGASATAHFDPERLAYIYKISYKFNIRCMPWNIVWRAPKQARDSTGMLKWTQAGHPIWVEGPAGRGAWDRPYPNLYSLGDLGPMLGLPSMPIIRTPRPPQPGDIRVFSADGSILSANVTPTCGDGIGGSERVTI